MITDQFEHLLDRFDDIISGKTRDMLTDIDVAECYSLSKKIIDQKSDDCLGWNCLRR